MGKTERIVLTPKQERWLTNHFKHTKNSECAERLGISPRSVVWGTERSGRWIYW